LFLNILAIVLYFSHGFGTILANCLNIIPTKNQNQNNVRVRMCPNWYSEIELTLN
jgi:hypothetical protein